MKKDALIDLAKSVCTVLQDGLRDETLPGTKIKIVIMPPYIELSISDEYQLNKQQAELTGQKYGRNYKLYIDKPYKEWRDITINENRILQRNGEFYDPEEKDKKEGEQDG